jgi:hypothetical protein
MRTKRHAVLVHAAKLCLGAGGGVRPAAISGIFVRKHPNALADAVL